MILNLTAAEIAQIADGTLPGTVIGKAVRLQMATTEQIEGQLDIDDVLAEMHAPTEEESRAAYERR